MTTEAQDSPVAESQIPAPVTDEAPQEQPEAVTPDSEAKPAETPDKPEESEESKALKRMQRRIDKRTADVYRERAEKEQLAQRLARLEAKEEPGEAPSQDFESAVRQRAREIAQAETFNAKCNAVSEAGQKLEGFSEAVKALAEEAPLFDQSGRPTDVLKVILESDNPAALMHHLGKNPDVAADLADLSPTQMARRLDRIERDLSAPPKTSKAPAPIEPIAAGKTPIADLNTSDMDAYMKARAKQGARWAR